MLTVRRQQHSFSTHERVFLRKCKSFWDRKCLDMRVTRTPKFRIHAECSKSNQIKFISHKYRNDIYTNTACIYLWAVNQKSRSLSSWLPWHGKKSTQKTPFNSIIIIIIFTININNNYNNYIINSFNHCYPQHQHNNIITTMNDIWCMKYYRCVKTT